jgi:hypothetical protein
MNPTKHVANVKLLLLVKLFAFFKEPASDYISFFHRKRVCNLNALQICVHKITQKLCITYDAANAWQTSRAIPKKIMIV